MILSSICFITGNFVSIFFSIFFSFNISAKIFTWRWQVESFLEELHFIQLKRASFSEYIKFNYLIKSNAHPLHNINSFHTFHVHCAWHTFWELSYNSCIYQLYSHEQYQHLTTISTTSWFQKSVFQIFFRLYSSVFSR